MALIGIDELKDCLKPSQPLIGVDLGDKTLGIAVSDTRRKIATALKTIRRTAFVKDVNELINLIEEFNVGGIIMGMPYHMNGSEGDRCKITRTFVRRFGDMCEIPVVLWDERCTTKAVTQLFLEGDLSRAKRGMIVDKVAASFMLQGALDYLSDTSGASFL
jgi:putative Holliday junction resolvase